MAFLTVVIPCYNHGRFVSDAIRSVEQHPEKAHYEIIIVNDGSTDAHTLQTFRQLELDGYRVIHQSNKGLAAARNTGIRHAQTEYILPLDSDNLVRPTYITEGIQILREQPAVGVVYGYSNQFGAKNYVNEVPEFDLKKLLLQNYIDACAIYRKSLWEQVGGYDEKMPVMGYEDWDFWLTIATTGLKFHRIEKIVFDYRVRNDSMINTTNLLNNQKILLPYIFKKHVHLYDLETLSKLFTDAALASIEISKCRGTNESYQKKIEALKARQKNLLKNNVVLCKQLVKNIIALGFPRSR